MTRKASQEKPFGWGAVIAVALGGYIVGDMGDAEQAQFEPIFVEVPAEEAPDAQVQSLFEPTPQEPEPEPEPVYEAPTFFANCSAARAAGAAPVRRGDPGYSWRSAS